MYHEFATDPKVQMLSEVNQRRYIMLLCLKCSNGDVTLHDEEVAFQLRISNEEWLASKSIFISKNLIDDQSSPVAWNKRQFESDSSSARVARHREKKKLDVTLHVTKCNALDTDSDSDIKTIYVETETVSGEDEPENVVDISTKRKPSPPYQEIVNLYHATLPTLGQIYKLTDTRKTRIKNLWADELDNLNAWGNYFKHVARSDFLMGRTPPSKDGRVFIADFDFITNPTNFVKIAEEKYHGKKVQR